MQKKGIIFKVKNYVHCSKYIDVYDLSGYMQLHVFLIVFFYIQNHRYVQSPQLEHFYAKTKFYKNVIALCNIVDLSRTDRET